MEKCAVAFLRTCPSGWTRWATEEFERQKQSALSREVLEAEESRGGLRKRDQATQARAFIISIGLVSPSEFNPGFVGNADKEVT